MGGAGLGQERSYLTRDSASVCWRFPSNAAPPSSGIRTAIYSPRNSRDSKFLGFVAAAPILAHFKGSLVTIFQIILPGPIPLLLFARIQENEPVYDVPKGTDTSSSLAPTHLPREIIIKSLFLSHSQHDFQLKTESDFMHGAVNRGLNTHSSASKIKEI